MKILKMILRASVSSLFWILTAFWAGFLFSSIVYFIEGGPDRVLHWYMHISGGMELHSLPNGTVVGHLDPWNPRLFLARLIANLLITVLLYFLRGRLRDRNSDKPTSALHVG